MIIKEEEDEEIKGMVMLFSMMLISKVKYFNYGVFKYDMLLVVFSGGGRVMFFLLNRYYCGYFKYYRCRG